MEVPNKKYIGHKQYFFFIKIKKNTNDHQHAEIIITCFLSVYLTLWSLNIEVICMLTQLRKPLTLYILCQ